MGLTQEANVEDRTSVGSSGLVDTSSQADRTGQTLLTNLPAHTLDTLYIARPRSWLAVILIAYFLAAVSYAVYTPVWQSPDEPAHYNYIAHIATKRTLPVLEMGDYDQELLSSLLNSRFATPQLISSLRYESHQPPLYYLLATPIYWFSGGHLLALRMFSVLLGACTVLLLYLSLELVFPTKTLIVVGATAFAALLPMHVSILSSVNNDSLAELLVMASMLSMLAWMRSRFYQASDASSAQDEVQAAEFRQTNSGDVGNITDNTVRERQQLLLLGLLLGLGMLTKVYAYVLAPILVAAIVFFVWLGPRIEGRDEAVTTNEELDGPSWRTFWAGIRLAMWAIVPALVLGALWWVRNYFVYGGLDLLGLQQHSKVVLDQPRTVEWIQANGWLAYGERAFGFTFQSFWGVFGWMSVFMDQRYYTAFLLFTGIIFLGVLWAVVRLISGRPDADMDLFQLSVLGLFGVMIVAVLAAFLWYNLEFVQHQGRYFFWGLLPLSTVVALGWREVMQPLQGLITAVLTLFVAGGLAMVGYVIGTLSEWTILMTGCFALLLMTQPVLLTCSTGRSNQWLPIALQKWLMRPIIVGINRWSRALMWALPFILLFVLNLLIPHLYIVPQLSW